MSSERRNQAIDALNREVRGWQADQELFDSVVVELAGLNRTDWRCLDILGTRGPMTAGQLAEAVRLTTGAVTGVLDRLEAAGLVRRIRDTQDRRRVIVELTDKVDALGAPVYGPLVADAAAAHDEFDADQLELITRFIRIERSLLAKHVERVAKMVRSQQLDERARGDSSARSKPSKSKASANW
jgi:DNA-binding MarR family transcriptional regulator